MEKKDLRTRRFVAKYIQYLTVFGYFFVATMGIIVAVLWFVKIDDVAGSGGEIRPAEHALKHNAEAVILKVLVTNHADVMEGQDLVEICDDPEWVERYRSAKQNGSEQEEMRGEMPRDLVDVLRAPHSGVAVVGKNLEGRIIPAGWDIVKVIDFDDLRITAEVDGTNVTNVHTGQRVKVEPLTTYGNKEILRSDVDYPDRWRNGSAQFNSVGKGKIKDLLQAYFAEKAVMLEDEEETTFSVSNVRNVELQGILRVAKLPQGEEPGGVVEAEPFIGAMLTGYVHEATHTASLRIRDLPDSVRSEIKQTLLDRFQAGIRVDGSDLSVVQIDDLKVVVEMDATYKESEESVTADDGSPLLGEETDRNCWVTVKLIDLPPAFTAKVRQLALAEKPSYIAAALEVVVGVRRIAMLLFRKN